MQKLLLVNIIICGLIFPVSARSGETEYITFGVGVFEFDGTSTFGIRRDGDHGFEDENDNRTSQIALSYRGPEIAYSFYPLVGGFVNGEEGKYGYAGVQWEYEFADGGYVFAPSISAGAYDQGDSKDLGGTFMFRPAISLEKQLSNGRLGLTVEHLSHAYLDGEENPGSESVLISYSLPVNLFGY